MSILNDEALHVDKIIFNIGTSYNFKFNALDCIISQPHFLRDLMLRTTRRGDKPSRGWQLHQSLNVGLAF